MKHDKSFSPAAGATAWTICPLKNRASLFAAASVVCLALAGCGSTPDSGKKAKFSPKKYGVAASPKVVASGKPVPKGGGRSFVGKPYKIAGKWYRPKEDPDYEKVGYASWYGPTFHGRMTANGEIFDRNALTAAHTTMPLPSYARVTNMKNGRSMIVRVNDRGPFHGNREIDLSERVAEMLDYKSKGVAKVKVEYVGRAPLHGNDQAYLMASYSGPGAAPAGGTMPGTMLARANKVIMPTSVASLQSVSGGASAHAPVPPTRPYLSPTLVARAAPTFNDQVQVAYDPALAFETSKQTIQIASANTFVAPVSSVSYAPAATSSASSYAGNGANVLSSGQPIGLLPTSAAPSAAAPHAPPALAPASGTLGVLPASYGARGFKPGASISSYAANSRIAGAYEQLGAISGGVTLKDLTSVSQR